MGNVTSDMLRLMALRENMGRGEPSPLQLMLLGKIDTTAKASVIPPTAANQPPVQSKPKR